MDNLRTMHPVKIEANKLLDIAETEDREAYKEAMRALRDRVPEHFYRDVVYWARVQHLTWRRYRRLFAWRSEWRRQKRGGRDASVQA